MSSAPAVQVPPEPTPIRPESTRERPVTLPLPLTSFVGREREVDAVVALLADPRTRLVTLAGPGGVGKTRLAIHLADRIAPVYPGGVWFVSLASIQDPELVAGAIAQVVAPPTAGLQTAEEHIVAELRAGRSLLILDNFEHLLSAASLIGRIVNASLTLTILVTSRAHLQIAGEHVFAVPPLDVPGPGSGCLAEQDAVRLFAERAADMSLTQTPETLEAIAMICRRVDGLPLAIELAAAWTGVLPLTQLLDRLSARLPMLMGGSRDSPTRHQTMRDSIAWSYDLLSPDEQAVFRRAGVFVGGFCLEGIEEVAADAVGRSEVLLHLRSLSDKSLIRPVPVADVPRFQMLETIREFALGQLEAAGEIEAARAVHAEWCVGFAERFGNEVVGPQQAEWRRWAHAEMDNARAALDYLHERGAAQSAARLAGRGVWFWLYPGRLIEGRATLERVLAMPGVNSYPESQAGVLLGLGGVENWLGNHTAARCHFEQALAVCRASCDEPQTMIALRGLGNLAISAGNLDEAIDLLAEVQERSEIGWDIAYATYLLGIAWFAKGDFTSSLACHEEALRLFRAKNDQEYIANSLEALGRVSLHLGDRAGARAAFGEMMEQSARDDAWCMARALRGLGAVAARDGDLRRAARLFAAAERRFIEVGTRPWVQVEEHYDRIRDGIRRSLGEQTFANERARGEAFTTDEAIAEGNRVIAAAVRPDVDASVSGLTRRENEVLGLVSEGLTDKEIADRLYISRRTASKHVESILAKFGVDSRRAAALQFGSRE